MMAKTNIHDVAKYIFEQLGEHTISQMKLYKLLWFCQGWHYAAKDKALFPEKFAAWTYGPIPMDLWALYKGNIYLREYDFRGDSSKVKGKSANVVDKVLKHYGSFSSSRLCELSHKCKPWIDHYSNAIPFQRIPNREIKAYFQSRAEIVNDR